ncbi:hypothetical protein RHMOL_Rhmol13G0285200 [Rhododendron molle]|uniref:Uncharacterized protein n=2 Tax=Rhododendron molle TaxID=49168 RepID=A0ACC0LCS4_RHOML|nr:hypothetical protein RHMOL_Rhmol13G0285200 [Rhododendron molle]
MQREREREVKFLERGLGNHKEVVDMEGGSSSFNSAQQRSKLEMLQKEHEEKMRRIQELKKQMAEAKIHLEEKKNEVPEGKREAFRMLTEKYNNLRDEYNNKCNNKE